MIHRHDPSSQISGLCRDLVRRHDIVDTRISEITCLGRRSRHRRLISRGPAQFFAADEATAIEAIVDCIIPPDPDTPGGKEAGLSHRKASAQQAVAKATKSFALLTLQ